MASFLEKAIEEKNIRKIRSALGTYIMTEPTDRKGEISNAVNKIEQLGINIWEDHDERDLETDQAKWDKNYFTELQAQLETNFSKQRFNRTLQVGRYVYKDELIKPISEPSRQTRPVNPRQQQSSPKRNSSGKIIVAGMVVVVAVTAMYFVMKNQ